MLKSTCAYTKYIVYTYIVSQASAVMLISTAQRQRLSQNASYKFTFKSTMCVLLWAGALLYLLYFYFKPILSMQLFTPEARVHIEHNLYYVLICTAVTTLYSVSLFNAQTTVVDAVKVSSPAIMIDNMRCHSNSAVISFSSNSARACVYLKFYCEGDKSSKLQQLT